MVWTSPSGHTYRTAPGSKLLVPALCVPTGSLKIRRREDVSTHRGAMMPTRRRTRAADRHYRVMAERTRYADPMSAPSEAAVLRAERRSLYTYMFTMLALAVLGFAVCASPACRLPSWTVSSR